MSELPKRTKTDMRLSPNIHQQVKVLSGHLGVTASSIHSIAAAEFILRYARLIESRKTRRQIIQAMQRDIEQLIDELKGIA